MEHIGIGIIVTAVIAVVIILCSRLKKRKGIPFNAIGIINAVSVKGKVPPAEINKVVIQTEMLPMEAIEDERKLVEITNSKVLTQITKQTKDQRVSQSVSSGMVRSLPQRLLQKQMVGSGAL